MGLSIHYSGSIKNEFLLSAMIEEVKDIVAIFKWQYKIYETTFPKNTMGKKTYDGIMYGISFTPPNSESISLTFLSNGKLCCGARLLFFGNSKNYDEDIYLYTISSKTQYSGSTNHKLIINLLKYISEKYFKSFELNDEGEYWETGNEAHLETRFKLYNSLVNGFADALQVIPINKEEELDSYFKRILKFIESKRKKE